MRFIFFILVLSLILSQSAFAFNVDIFIKESTQLIGRNLREIDQKTNLERKKDRESENTVIYGASDTGLRAENECKGIDFYFKGNKLITILCNTTEEIASEAIDRAYKDYQDKGGGVGSGTYFWCVYNKGLEIAIAMPMMNYIAIHESCPAGSLERYK